MMDFRSILRETLSVLVGGALYVGLNWIPLAGPLLAGGIVGFYSSRGARRCFELGLLSGLLGFLAVGLIVANSGLLGISGSGIVPAVFLGWILLVWNVVGILACGVGGVFGVIAKDLSPAYNFFMKHSSSVPHDGRVVYRICPACNEGTPDSSGFCVKCGSAVL